MCPFCFAGVATTTTSTHFCAHKTAHGGGGGNAQNGPGRSRTCNLWFRRPTPYPLGHRVSHQLVALTRITAKTICSRKRNPGRTRTCNLWPGRPTPYFLGHRVSHQLVALTRITAKAFGSRKSDSGSIRTCNRCFVSQPAKVCQKQCLIHLATGPSAVRHGNQRPSGRKDQLYNAENEGRNIRTLYLPIWSQTH